MLSLAPIRTAVMGLSICAFLSAKLFLSEFLSGLIFVIYYFGEPSLSSPQIDLGHSCYFSVYYSKIWNFQIDYRIKMFCIRVPLHASHLRLTVRTLTEISGGLTKNLKVGEVRSRVCDQQEESLFHRSLPSFSYLWCWGWLKMW